MDRKINGNSSGVVPVPLPTVKKDNNYSILHVLCLWLSMIQTSITL